MFFNHSLSKKLEDMKKLKITGIRGYINTKTCKIALTMDFALSPALFFPSRCKQKWGAI
jgi:hypothetical protein